MKRTATALLLLLLVGSTAKAQQGDVDFVMDVPVTDDYFAPYRVGDNSGARAVSGPFDMDGDGLVEYLMSDYTGGGRVHVIENKGVGLWEHVYSTPWLDSTNTGSFNARYAYGTSASSDLDGDGRGEIILPTGRFFSATNPNYAGQRGLFVFEYTGNDDDYGDAPASILALKDTSATDLGLNYPRIQTGMEVMDIDGDGTNELIFANNPANAYDYFYVYSVLGDIGSGFETWVEEFALNPRNADYGGGSPEGAWPADLDGDGQKEIMLHAWNNYNFIPALVTGADTYSTTEGNYLRATLGGVDAVAFAGGTVIDINQDGDDEIFLNNYDGSGTNPDEYKLTLINYEDGEDVSTITADQITMGLLDENFTWGLTSGDWDNDGNNEVIGVGFGYPGADAAAGVPARFIRMAEFSGGPGGDAENPANYQVSWIETADDAFTAGTSTVTRDSLGTESTVHLGSGIFAFRAAYLGDADGDGRNEVVIGFQGVPDSSRFYTQEWVVTDTTAAWGPQVEIPGSAQAASARAFSAVVSLDEKSVAREARIVVPSDYRLSENYPNPFNPTTTFSFTLPIDKVVSVNVYDVQGRLVKTLVNNQAYAKGTYEVQWDGTNASGASVASGTYLYTLEYGNFRQTRQMVLVK
jgi:hypothetical protein